MPLCWRRGQKDSAGSFCFWQKQKAPNPKATVYLREDVGSICCSCGQGSEEGGLPCCLDSVDHAQSQVLEVGGLAVGVDENKDIINPWKKRGEILILCSQ